MLFARSRGSWGNKETYSIKSRFFSNDDDRVAKALIFNKE